MQTSRLNRRQRRQLRTQAKNAKDAQIVRRAIALLELDEGRSAAEVAATLGVTRQTMYNWRARLEAADVPGALRDRSGRGRRSVWTEPVRRFLSSGGVGQARRAGPGPVERPQRPARALRRHQPANRAPGAAVRQQPVRDGLLRPAPRAASPLPRSSPRPAAVMRTPATRRAPRSTSRRSWASSCSGCRSEPRSSTRWNICGVPRSRT